MPDRTFTPGSARLMLDAVRPAAERMRDLYCRLERRRPPRIVPDQRVDPTYFALVRRLHAVLDEIRGCGAKVHDLRSGELVFPARRRGRVVLLSWRVGERSLEFWHEIGAGRPGRRRVDDDGPWDDP